MDEQKLLERITVNPDIFGGKPILRGRRLAVEHVLGMLAGGDTPEILLEGYPWLEKEDVQACLVYAGSWISEETHIQICFRTPKNILAVWHVREDGRYGKQATAQANG